MCAKARFECLSINIYLKQAYQKKNIYNTFTFVCLLIFSYMKILLALVLSVVLITATSTTIYKANTAAAQQEPTPFTAKWYTETPGVPMPEEGELVQVSLWDKVKSGAKAVGNAVQKTVQQAKKITNNAVQEAKTARNTVVNKIKGILPSGPTGHAPTRLPNQVAGDSMVHWYQFTSENLHDLGKAVTYTSGYLIGTGAAITAAVGACTTVVACAGGIALATPTVIAGTEYYHNHIKKLHGTGAKGDDILYPGRQIKDKDGTPCKISDTNIELLDSKYLVLQTGKSTSAKGSLPLTTFGAHLASSRPGTSDAFVQVHWWYDMGNAVRYRPVYTVDRVGCTIT
jgi:hypothetical protein